MNTSDSRGWRLFWRTACTALLIAAFAQSAAAQNLYFSTHAGGLDQPGYVDGSLTDARFRNVTGLTRDSAGNLYVADTGNHVIRKIATDGTVTTLAGAGGQPGASDGTGAAARFSYPWGLAVDGSGNVYVADSGNHTIRRITPAGVVTTFAGDAGVSGSNDGTGTAARFASPSGLAFDAAGNLFVSDYGNSTVRRITPAGAVTTFAGLAGQFAYVDATGTEARFNYPDGLAVDPDGNLFVADSNNNLVRRVTPAGAVTTFAGIPQSAGSEDGGFGVARFNSPVGLAFDGSRNLYVTDRGNSTIRRISSDGLVTTVGGLAGQAGAANGPGSTARFDFPTGIVVLSTGEMFIADTFNDSVRRGVVGVLSSNASTGSKAVWLMNGTAMTSEQTSALPADWQIVGFGQFNGDGDTDLVAQNNLTGMRAIWLMNDGSISSTVELGQQHLFWRISAVGDFTNDGQTDLLWQNRQTGQRVLWVMNGTARSSIRDLGTHNPNWQISGAADFDGDGRPDLLASNSESGAREIWILDNNAAVTGTVSLGSQHQGWLIAGAADFNADGDPDILWQDVFSGLRVLWVMDGTQRTTVINLGTHARAWQMAAVLDANADGQNDIVWQNRSLPPLDFDGDSLTDLAIENVQTGERAVWLMNGTQIRSQEALPSAGTDWQFAALADFNGDRSPDIILQNLQDGRRLIWIMNELEVASTVDLGTQATSWRIAGAADFNGDSQIDLVWQNIQTGQRTIWFMDGPTFNSSVDLGSQPLSWEIVGAADFNGDGQAEIIWQNRVSGQVTAWFMNGVVLGSAVSLGTHDPALHIAAAADFNGDGQTDFVVQNINTGERFVWLMNGFQVGSVITVGTYPVAWQISN